VTDTRPPLSVLEPPEAWELLRSGHVGRVGIEEPDGLVIVPVNYAVDGEQVIFRTQEDHLLGRAATWGRRCAFQVDHLDDEIRQGWSVLVRGELRRASDEDVSRLSGLVAPWAAGDRTVVGRILTERIDGRRIGWVS
jgi:nitroimidazol reductase NimA-like FMN-containing flavoprotein (pyridoxamine 5'-phosphate oxidase superfamily)